MAKNFTGQLSALMESEKAAEPKKTNKAPSKADTAKILKGAANKVDAELKELQKLNPKIKKIEDLPKEVINAVADRPSLVDAYKEYQKGQPIKVKVVPETKSKRLNLLIRPSVYNALQEKAAEQGTSINNLINDILQGAL